MNLIELFELRASSQPDQAAIIDPGKVAITSYGELLAQIDETAEILAEAGVKKGQCIGLHYRSGQDYIRFTYAVWRLGACVVPIPVELKTNEKLRICQDIVLHHIITDAAGKNELHATVAAPYAECAGGSIAEVRQLKQPPQEFTHVNAAFIRFTSGTTGASKGVVLSHETIRDRIAAANDVLKIDHHDRVLWLLSMSYHFAVSIVAYLSYGAAIILAPNHFARTLIDCGRQHGATLIYGAPVHYDLMAADKSEEKLPDLRLAISTTIALRRKTVEAFHRRFGVRLSQALGIIEIGLPCIDLEMPEEKWGTVGKLLPSYEIRMEDVGMGDRLKEIKFRGKGLFDAYYDPWRWREEVMADGWFSTGDLGVLDDDGYLFIHGRSKDVINVAGMKFFPQEVERVLDAHPQVVESCVYAHRHEMFGEVPHARVILQPGSELDETALKQYLANQVAPYKIPERLLFTDSLLHTASGKLVRDEHRILQQQEQCA